MNEKHAQLKSKPEGEKERMNWTWLKATVLTLTIVALGSLMVAIMIYLFSTFMQ